MPPVLLGDGIPLSPRQAPARRCSCCADGIFPDGTAELVYAMA